MIRGVTVRRDFTAWTDAAPVPDMPVSAAHPARRQRGPRTRGGARGIEGSPCSFLQDQLVQRQVRDRSTTARVLGFQLLQPLDLVTLQPAVLIAPAVVCNFRHTYRSSASATGRPCAISTSTCRSFATISSAVCLFLAIYLILLGQNHTSGRTISKGADQAGCSRDQSSGAPRPVISREARAWPLEANLLDRNLFREDGVLRDLGVVRLRRRLQHQPEVAEGALCLLGAGRG